MGDFSEPNLLNYSKQWNKFLSVLTVELESAILYRATDSKGESSLDNLQLDR